MADLNVYAASWCPHCQRTAAFLRDHQIPFVWHEIEEQPKTVVDKVIEVNGGDDWVVPTLEHDGHWRPGKVFDPDRLPDDLRDLGVKQA
jgi:mycoredoxin